MAKFKVGPKWKKVWLHFGLVIASITTFILLFFYAFLPWYTNHGEVIVVPNLHGMNEKEAIEVIEKLSLRYEILDSVYSEKDEPMTIISQNPKPNFEVKDNRRIYLTINTSTPPKITFTKQLLDKIISKDKTSATIILTSQQIGMKVGPPTYVPSKYKDLVLNLIINGQSVKSGNSFYKGSTATLVVSTGKPDNGILSDSTLQNTGSD